MNRKADEVLDYATPAAALAGSRPAFFLGGVLLAELLSIVILAILQSGGPIFPFTMLSAPLAIVLEIMGTARALYLSLFVEGPLLYGVYAMLLALPSRLRNLSGIKWTTCTTALLRRADSSAASMVTKLVVSKPSLNTKSSARERASDALASPR